MSILEIKALKKFYTKDKMVLKGMDAHINEGEFVVVIGPSGAGKSTFIRCMNGMVNLSSGEIIFDGEEMSKLRGKKLRRARAKIGMIFQHYNLIGRTNVIKNVLHGKLGQVSFIQSAFGLYAEKDKQEAYQLLKTVGLSEHIYKKAKDLSGGQMQRVGICRAMMQNPKLLLADEPIASLDPKSAQLVMDLIYQMVKERDLTCIMNLHQVDVAKKYATRIIGIKDGQIVYDGRPEALTDAMINHIYEGKEAEMHLPSEGANRELQGAAAFDLLNNNLKPQGA